MEEVWRERKGYLKQEILLLSQSAGEPGFQDRHILSDLCQHFLSGEIIFIMHLVSSFEMN